VVERSHRRFRSPTALLIIAAVLALLGLAAVFGYNASQPAPESDDYRYREATVSPKPKAAPPPVEVLDEPVASGSTVPDLTDASPGSQEVVQPPPIAARRESPTAREIPRPQPRVAEPEEVLTTDPSEDEDPEPVRPDEGSNAVSTVRAFYNALGDGDGDSAARFVVPGKRGAGPLSAGELTRYFSSFRRPLRVLRATQVSPDTVRVAYDYVLPNGALCEGRAAVRVTDSGDGTLIRSIRTLGPC
jgi:hypothetical protein